MATKRSSRRRKASLPGKTAKELVNRFNTGKGSEGARRSRCPISFALDRIGDRWSLLLVRDLALNGKCSFSELLRADEGVATNVLTDRLTQLENFGLISKRRSATDLRRYEYRLTEAGKDFIPVLVELLLWGVAHDQNSVVPGDIIDRIKRDRKGFIRKARKKLDAMRD